MTEFAVIHLVHWVIPTQIEGCLDCFVLSVIQFLSEFLLTLPVFLLQPEYLVLSLLIELVLVVVFLLQLFLLLTGNTGEVLCLLLHLETDLLVPLLLSQYFLRDSLFLQFLLVIPTHLVIHLILETVIIQTLVLIIDDVYETHGLIVITGVPQD